MSLQAGDIVILYDATAQGALKSRMFLCLSPADGYFARITAEPRGRQPFPLAEGHPRCIAKDCFVETGIPVEFSEDEIENSLAQQGIIGALDSDQARALIGYWLRVMSTPPSAQRVIIAALSGRYGL